MFRANLDGTKAGATPAFPSGRLVPRSPKMDSVDTPFFPDDIDGQVVWLNQFAKSVMTYGPILEIPATVAAEAQDLARGLRFIKMNIECALGDGEMPGRETVMAFSKVQRWVREQSKYLKGHMCYTPSLGRVFGVERRLAA